MTLEPIPFLDLVTPHRELENQLLDLFRRALSTGQFIGGPMVESFEGDFARFCDVNYGIGVGSGTDALRFALIAGGISPGDIVLTAPNTFIATTEAISQAGALPVFLDVDERTYNMDPEKLLEYLQTRCDPDDRTGRPVERKTGRRVWGVVPVHLYGQPADMDRLLEIAEAHRLTVVEDACQAHGAEYFSKKEGRWRKAGSMGRAAAFSFYPGKNLGACGEAGAVTTNDAELRGKIRMLRDHGQARKYFHDVEGYNGRLDAIQAGALGIKLRRLSEDNDKRRRIARRYNELLEKVDGVITPHEPDWTRSVYHLYVIRAQERDALQKHFSENHIATGLHYPLPLHLQKAYANLGYREGDFPVTEKIASEILSLPIYPGLTEDQQARVAETIGRF